jgi:hypothetical protein
MSNQILEKKNKLDKLTNIVKNNIKLFIIIISFAVISLIVMFFINLNLEKKNEEISEKFNKANIFLENKKNNDALNILKKIIGNKHKFYSPLSLNLIVEKKLIEDQKEVINLFNEVILIKGVNKDNKNLIKIKKALFIMNTANEDEILEILNPIINSKSLWRSQAINLVSDYFLNRGEDLKSKQFLELLNKEIKN